LTSINLSKNQLCGVWENFYGEQQGQYDPAAILALAETLKVGFVVIYLSS
jgi:hypothetical protein